MRTDFAGSGQHDIFNADGTITPGLTPEAHLREQLAEATALLREAGGLGLRDEYLERVDAFLSGAPAQPAAPEPSGEEMPTTELQLRVRNGNLRALLLAAEAKLAAVAEHVGYFAQDVAAARKSREPQTGMHVPYHGDFAGANPTVIRQLERWVRRFQELLRTPGETPSDGGGNG
jgi:hypothetical protein